jgi:hypothetical protein
MTPPDSYKVTNALLAKLQGDSVLAGLMPDGTWLEEAPPGAQQFVIVSPIQQMTNVRKFGGLAYKEGVYLVEARARSTTTGDVQAAAARLAVLLNGGDLTIANYAVVDIHCDEDVENVEVDEVDSSIRWNRCGGMFHIMVAPVN